MRFDLHVHSRHSACSRLSIDDILTLAHARALDGVCITDHHCMGARHELVEGVQANGLCVLVGMEYGTPQGDFLLFGSVEAVPPHLEAKALLQSVRDRGGIAIAAHPLRAGRRMDEELFREGLCRTIETINGRNTRQENLAADRWRRRYDLTDCGGSDAHTPEELGTIATRFSVPVRSLSELIQALQGGLCRPEMLAPRRPLGSRSDAFQDACRPAPA